MSSTASEASVVRFSDRTSSLQWGKCWVRETRRTLRRGPEHRGALRETVESELGPEMFRVEPETPV